MDTSYQLADYLKDHHQTERSAVKGRELRMLFNLTDKQVRNVISSLRQEGIPVCSSSAGYWYSEDPDDIGITLHRLEAQVEHMGLSIKGLRKAQEGKG